MDWKRDVRSLKGIGPKRASELHRLGIDTIQDLLSYYPRAYEDRSRVKAIASLVPDEPAAIRGVVRRVQEKRPRRGLSILMAYIDDGTGMISVSWFNQRYLSGKIKAGVKVFIAGKVGYAFGGHGQLAMKRVTAFEILDGQEGTESLCGIFPIYSVAGSLSQTFFHKIFRQIFAEDFSAEETVPPKICAKYKLMGRTDAVRAIHFPENLAHLKHARDSLAFEELYLIQCGLFLIRKHTHEEKKGIRHLPDHKLIRTLLSLLPFALTEDQATAWKEIKRDMERPIPMRRLVQGDVGSGKTVIAMLALVKTVENGLQGALMAPTEILAEQHYESFCRILEPLGIRITLLTGRWGREKRQTIYETIAAHDVDIVIGTHALIQDGVSFASLGLVVTDEQHRFGIAQRAKLAEKGKMIPDALIMTATPIPRTMTLTIYGDLDVSTIWHLPPGRKPIRTFLRPMSRRPLIYQYIRKQIESGRQAYVVCPLVEHSDGMDLMAAEEVYEELRANIMRGISCGLVHGRMKAAEKDRVMQAFYKGEIQLLVATTVIEIGVNVPNASVMVIEHAERFGLSQLHQLRGRIGRGSYDSCCILVSEMQTESARERLHLMVETTDGFTLAEADLRLRGPGQFFGSLQHGIPDLKVANVLQDMDILLKARKAAMETVHSHEGLDAVLPILMQRYQAHFLHILHS